MRVPALAANKPISMLLPLFKNAFLKEATNIYTIQGKCVINLACSLKNNTAAQSLYFFRSHKPNQFVKPHTEMNWTGNEDNTQTLWAIFPCHTHLWDIADVYNKALLTKCPFNVVYIIVQIQTHTLEKLLNLATKLIAQVQLWQTPRIHPSQS